MLYQNCAFALSKKHNYNKNDNHHYHLEIIKMDIKKQKGTNGSVHYVGTKKLVDLETGEQFEAQTIVKTIGDREFKKLFLGAVLDKLDGFSNAKMKFLVWLLENADRQNRVIGTIKQLSDTSGISFATVARLMPILKDSDILRQQAPSVYMINPDLMASVTSSKRGALLVKYKNLDDQCQGEQSVNARQGMEGDTPEAE
ncbi:replication/maintenance protein RepL [Escherichia coli]|uniref:replication/maintenance protein RepL n=1 Tax=Escherichia coli TaxID=562 RepID=UPI0018B07B99|nr:replication/maintenance protein RepL [Escherichia coli]MBF9726170.1 replication/maintenance protein RepL [Escherichia coli]